MSLTVFPCFRLTNHICTTQRALSCRTQSVRQVKYFSDQNEADHLQSVPGGGGHRLQHQPSRAEGCEGEGGWKLPSDVHHLHVVRGETNQTVLDFKKAFCRYYSSSNHPV